MNERKIKISSGLYDAYKLYREEYTRTVGRQLYSKICQDFNKNISNKIVKESYEFKIPFRLGIIRIRAFKPKLLIKNGKIDTSKLLPNWKATKELWGKIYPGLSKEELKKIPNKKIVIFINEHSDGYSYKWVWDRRLAKFRNMNFYIFKPVKGGVLEDGKHYGRIGLGKWIKSAEKTNEYYE